MTRPSQEDILWALEWALENLSQEPPSHDWSGWTPIQINEWKADRTEASEILDQAQKADAATATEKRTDEDQEPLAAGSPITPPVCPACGGKHLEVDCFWKGSPWPEGPA